MEYDWAASAQPPSQPLSSSYTCNGSYITLGANFLYAAEASQIAAKKLSLHRCRRVYCNVTRPHRHDHILRLLQVAATQHQADLDVQEPVGQEEQQAPSGDS